MAANDVAADDVVPEPNMTLTSDTLLVQCINFQPHQPTAQRHISLLGHKNFLDTLLEIE